MDTLSINLLALQEESFEAAYVLGDEYFGGLDDVAIQKGDVRADVVVTKATSDDYTLDIRVSGTVIVPCDRCLDDMEQPVEGTSSYKVKIGGGTPADDEVIAVSEKDGILSMAWPVYETIALAVPIKHVHAPGKCNDAMTQKLEELSATRSGDGAEEENVDPRWAELKKLKH